LRSFHLSRENLTDSSIITIIAREDKDTEWQTLSSFFLSFNVWKGFCKSFPSQISKNQVPLEDYERAAKLYITLVSKSNKSDQENKMELELSSEIEEFILASFALAHVVTGRDFLNEAAKKKRKSKKSKKQRKNKQVNTPMHIILEQPGMETLLSAESKQSSDVIAYEANLKNIKKNEKKKYLLDDPRGHLRWKIKSPKKNCPEQISRHDRRQYFADEKLGNSKIQLKKESPLKKKIMAVLSPRKEKGERTAKYEDWLQINSEKKNRARVNRNQYATQDEYSLFSPSRGKSRESYRAIFDKRRSISKEKSKSKMRRISRSPLKSTSSRTPSRAKTSKIQELHSSKSRKESIKHTPKSLGLSVTLLSAVSYFPSSPALQKPQSPTFGGSPYIARIPRSPEKRKNSHVSDKREGDSINHQNEGLTRKRIPIFENLHSSGLNGG